MSSLAPLLLDNTRQSVLQMQRTGNEAPRLQSVEENVEDPDSFDGIPTRRDAIFGLDLTLAAPKTALPFSGFSYGPNEKTSSISGRRKALLLSALSEDGNAPRSEPTEEQSEEGSLLIGSGIIFALKVQIATSVQMYDVFLSEVAHLRAFLNDDRVVQVKDWHEHRPSSRVYILMELGVKDLSSFCKQGAWKLDAGTICRLWRGLVDAVEALHAKKVIHFDLKPHNFLLCVSRGGRGPLGVARRASPPSSRTGDDDDQNLLNGEMALSNDVSLILKVGDFGLARTLEEQATHVSMLANTNLGAMVFSCSRTWRRAREIVFSQSHLPHIFPHVTLGYVTHVVVPCLTWACHCHVTAMSLLWPL